MTWLSDTLLSTLLKATARSALLLMLVVPLAVWVVWIAAGLTGCSSSVVRSAVDTSGRIDEGVAYGLPRTLASVTITSGSAGAAFKVEPVLVADESKRYALSLMHKGGRSDKLVVETTASGLLTSITLNTEDESSAIIAKLVETAAAAAQAPVAFGMERSRSERLPAQINVVFDPTSEADIDRVNGVLGAVQFRIGIRPAEPDRAALPGAAAPSSAARFSAVRYLRPRDMIVELYDLGSSNGRSAGVPVVSQSLAVAQAGEVFDLPLDAGPFVKTDYTLTFEDGQLTKFEATRPSEVLGFVSILPETLKSIIAIPSELIQLKIDTTARDNELLQKQEALIQAQQALLAAQLQQALAGGQNDSDRGDGPPDRGAGNPPDTTAGEDTDATDAK